jgi:hypothetical protein
MSFAWIRPAFRAVISFSIAAGDEDVDLEELAGGDGLDSEVSVDATLLGAVGEERRDVEPVARVDATPPPEP